MTSVVDRRVVVALAAISVFVFALVLVARSQAGSQAADFGAFVAPAQVTTGGETLAGAKFTPHGTKNSGSATHVTITLTLPTDAVVTGITCPGTSSGVGGNVATCTPGTVQNGQTVKMFVTFTAGGVAAGDSVIGNVSWDVPGGGGSTGGNNTLSSTKSFSVVDGTASAGTCSPNASDTLTATSPTGKGASFAFGKSDSSLGFPCTPAQVTIDPAQVTGATTPGSWSLLVAPLANGALANAGLTIATLPSPITWKKAQLFEVATDNSLSLVPACLTGGAMPANHDICLTGQAKFGQGVEFFVNVLGTGIDPRVSS